MRLNWSKYRDLYKDIPTPFRAKLWWVMVGMILKATLNFLGIAALLYIIMLAIIDQKWSEYLWVIALIGVAVLAIKASVVILIDRFKMRFLLSLYRYYSITLLEDYYRQGLPTIRKRGVGYLTHDVNSITLHYVTKYLGSLMNMLCELVLITLIVVTIAIYSPIAVACVLGIIIPVSAIYLYLVQDKISLYGAQSNELSRAHYLTIENTFRGYAELEINQAYGLMSERFNGELTNLSANAINRNTLAQLPQSILEITLACVILALIVTLADTTDSLKVMLGVLGVATIRIMPSVRSIINGWNVVKSTSYSLDVISQIDKTPRDENSCTTPITFDQNIDFRNVSFRYEADENDVVKDLSLTIHRGEYVGFRGRSGSGKSTIFNIMQGFFIPQSGGVYIDGVELTSQNRSSWHRLIGYVPQDVFIMTGSILENITFGVAPKDVDRKRVLEILSHIELSRWVESFEDGLDHIISGYGATISGGERQRIGIARALYKGARVLLFDEATSSLDSGTEQSVMGIIENLKREDKTLTMVMIAHRESTLTLCDRVIDVKQLDIDEEL